VEKNFNFKKIKVVQDTLIAAGHKKRLGGYIGPACN